MASREETQEKEKPVTRFSQTVSDLFHNYKGMVDNKLFRITIMTASSQKDLKSILDAFVTRNFGICVFYKPSIVSKSHGTEYTVYASRLTEEEIIKIFNLKAFW